MGNVYRYIPNELYSDFIYFMHEHKHLKLTYDAESGCIRLNAAQLARFAIVHRICCHQIWQESWMRANHLIEGCFLESGPRAVDHGNAILSDNCSDDDKYGRLLPKDAGLKPTSPTTCKITQSNPDPRLKYFPNVLSCKQCV